MLWQTCKNAFNCGYFVSLACKVRRVILNGFYGMLWGMVSAQRDQRQSTQLKFIGHTRHDTQAFLNILNVVDHLFISLYCN